MKKAWLFLLACIYLAGCAFAQPSPVASPADTPLPHTDTPLLLINTPAPRFTHLYAFGDSYSDNGNGFSIAVKEMVAEGELDAEFQKWFETYYWEGRISNGPTAVEVLANQLNVGLTDYAVGGAKSDVSNNIDWNALQNTGILKQVEKFKSDFNGENADPEALYFIHISINDFLALLDKNPSHDKESTINQADRSVENIIKVVTQLVDSGARQFMIVNSIDLSKLPVVISDGFVEDAKEFQSHINSRLPGEMQKLAQLPHVRITIFDPMTVSDEIWSNPNEYGFTDLTDYCMVADDTSTVVCESPDQYYFWDDIHPTRVVHQIMGEAMAEQLSK